jgi:hypothetical protein
MIVISGGQTGADIAGLKAAKKNGYKTGGYMPKGFKTLKGNKPEYAVEYGLKEANTYGYPLRTKLNVLNSDWTIWFEEKISPGKQCTYKYIKMYSKPYLDLNINKLPSISYVLEWIKTNEIKTLNIAGHSQETSKNIESVVYNYLDEIFANSEFSKTNKF